MASEVEIDDSLYSRQRYVLGDSAMQRMAKSHVLICGLGGLGVEIAKNIVLAGVKSVTLQDSQPATYHDLGTQFFLREEDVLAGKNRAEACLEKVAELNPYVSVASLTSAFTETSSLEVLNQYQCVIVTEATLAVQCRLNQYCRSQDPPIKYISADVYGLFGWTFCDFGDQFEVIDVNGEETKEVFVHKITKEKPGVVTTLENRMHGFESGDTVVFREVLGMSQLNGKHYQIKVLSPYSFTICDTSSEEYSPYTMGGIASQVKIPTTLSFRSLERELSSPSLLTPDLSKLQAPATIHLGMQALFRFQRTYNRLPNIQCRSDADLLIELAHTINADMQSKQVEQVDETLLRHLSFTSQGCLAPLCATLGGVVAQEGLKGLTGKFSPLSQWLCLDASELGTLQDGQAQEFQPQLNRYDALRACVGDGVCQSLADTSLFMVGCGAIGCEMMKNYALLGTATGRGKITITDNDLIEKSNLNRQFLFRPQHIRKPKSTTAATSAQEINPNLNICAHQHRVCGKTEASVYNDAFFRSQDVVVNALDNLEARRYMDSRCVTNCKPLLESGTMGAKGHVQVIVPHVTESYDSQRDPPDEDIPYCTLKSFPAVIEHCIQWARDKFESSFSQKPSLFNKFWSVNSSPSIVAEKLKSGQAIEGVFQTSKISALRPHTWQHCVAIGRLKFEKYFNHRAKQLLHSFPLDTKLQDGSLFWQSPKRPPVPVEFDPNNPTHVGFVASCAHLYADVCKVAWTSEDMKTSNICSIVETVNVPEFCPANKRIVTDESVKKSDDLPEEGCHDMDQAIAFMLHLSQSQSTDQVISPMQPASFEKDDDLNGHIDFITCAANLRASMYNIEQADRLKTKRIAGRIVPAIATTTAAVAGLVTIELIKVLQKQAVENYKNCFLNLALPVCVFSEPGAVEKTTMSNGVSYTLWDRWDIHGNKDTTLQDFINKLKEEHNVEVGMVVHTVKMVYVPIMPGHKKRLTHLMTKLVKASDRPYVDLAVAYVVPSGEDEMGPPVRYYFSS